VPVLPPNRRRAFQGVIPRGDGFVLSVDEAVVLLEDTTTDYSMVVRPYFGGKDITTSVSQGPSRFVIDFGVEPLEVAMRYPAALQLVRERVKPLRDTNPIYAQSWWRLWRPRPEFRRVAAGLSRFIAGTATGKRILFTWSDVDWRVSNAANMFALDTDYAMGVLMSRIHTEWAAKKSSTLRADIRYTPSSAFETFPWPQSDPGQRDNIARHTVELLALRSTLCREHEIGLTALYNAVDEGAFTALREAHRALDLAVVSAYGWSSALLDDVRARNRALFERNAAILAGDLEYSPF